MENSSSGEDIVNQFAEYFLKMYRDEDFILQDSLPTGDINLSRFTVTISSIYETLSTLDINKGPGPDGFPPYLTKHCSFYVLFILFLIYSSKLDFSRLIGNLALKLPF